MSKRTKIEILAELLDMPTEHVIEAAMEIIYEKVGVRPGDKVFISDPEIQYEVAGVKKFPHGWLVGIYDEPPGKHVDYWTPGALNKVEKK